MVPDFRSDSYGYINMDLKFHDFFFRGSSHTARFPTEKITPQLCKTRSSGPAVVHCNTCTHRVISYRKLLILGRNNRHLSCVTYYVSDVITKGVEKAVYVWIGDIKSLNENTIKQTNNTLLNSRVKDHSFYTIAKSRANWGLRDRSRVIISRSCENQCNKGSQFFLHTYLDNGGHMISQTLHTINQLGTEVSKGNILSF